VSRPKVTLDNLAAVLTQAGASLADVVRCGVFLADMADFAEMKQGLRGSLPAAAAGQDDGRVQLGGFKVEIDCVAVLPDQAASRNGSGPWIDRPAGPAGSTRRHARRRTLLG